MEGLADAGAGIGRWGGRGARGGSRSRGWRARMPFPHPDRPLDVLDAHLATVGEGDRDPVAEALIDDRGDADAARLGQRLQPRGDVDAVAINVVAVDDDVAEIDADPEGDARPGGRQVVHGALDGHGALDRIDDRGELDQRAVADQLDDASAMGGHRRIEDGLAVALERIERAGFVGAHHPRIADDIRRKDRGQPPYGALLRHAGLPMGNRRRAPARSAQVRPAAAWPLSARSASARYGGSGRSPRACRPRPAAGIRHSRLPPAGPPGCPAR